MVICFNLRRNEAVVKYKLNIRYLKLHTGYDNAVAGVQIKYNKPKIYNLVAKPHLFL